MKFGFNPVKTQILKITNRFIILIRKVPLNDVKAGVWCAMCVAVMCHVCSCGVLCVQLWCAMCAAVVCYVCSCGVLHVQLWCATCAAVVCYVCNCGVLFVQIWCAICATLVCYVCNFGVLCVQLWCAMCATIITEPIFFPVTINSHQNVTQIVNHFLNTHPITKALFQQNSVTNQTANNSVFLMCSSCITCLAWNGLAETAEIHRGLQC
jgi:hypothetical protein